jgi:hypothetical protein
MPRALTLTLAIVALLAACSDRATPTAPDLKAPTDHAAFEAGPNDRFVGSWSCHGSAIVVTNCLKNVSADSVGQKFVALELAIVQSVASSISGANTSCDATATALFVDRTSGKLTNGEPRAGCVVNTPQNVQTVIVYPNPYDHPVKREP